MVDGQTEMTSYAEAKHGFLKANKSVENFSKLSRVDSRPNMMSEMQTQYVDEHMGNLKI
jgi:hypothetical protein